MVKLSTRSNGRGWLACIVVLAAVASGCGKNDDALQVTGTVKRADGSALQFESGTVIFQADEPGKFASGSVQPDGTFTLMTKKPGDGVKPGHYKVIVQLWKNYHDQTRAVPDKYTDPAATPLEATVDAEHVNFEFTIEE